MDDALLSKEDPEQSLVSYCVSPGEQFLLCLEVTTVRPVKVFVRVKNLKSNSKVGKYELPMDISSTVLEKESFGIKLVQASIAHKNKAEVKHYIIINTGDGLSFLTLEQLFSVGGEIPRKWQHSSFNDTITSFHGYNVRGCNVQVVYATKLGAVVKFDFNIASGAFKKLEEHKDVAADSINTCSPCMPVDIDPLTTYIPELVFSSFDNNLYSLENTLQKLPIFEPMTENKTLVSASGVIAKQYSTKSLRYYVANVLNSGCHLFKRSANDDWDKVQLFERHVSSEEFSPFADCLVSCYGRTQLRIATGSECGKIFYWRYDYRDELILESNELEVGREGDTVYGLQLLGSNVYYMVNRDFIDCRTIN
ncbi:LANO_0C02872g1_1 [Lachancea nothofagi CBS 11611]|uniref:LANO_0C02872g1_1 n=1 Tax=Lachancea nothofagi CBS 11611 TaxID=1266666 RepID=A0A1G4J5X4_9SACH|nr:LANO_0C02872g1_1 [Lachancea nothofagi CBS 11611]